MKTITSWLVPLSLTLCAALVIGALTWITRGTIAAERELAQADTRADIQERTRLALWRMDSLGASLLLEESRFPDADSRLPIHLRFTLSPKGEVGVTNTAESTRDKTLLSTIGTGSKALDCVAAITMTPVVTTPPPEATSAPQQGKDLSHNEESRKFQQRAPYNRLDSLSQQAANWDEQNVRTKAVQSYLDNAVAASSPRYRAASPSPPTTQTAPPSELMGRSSTLPKGTINAKTPEKLSLAKRREISPAGKIVALNPTAKKSEAMPAPQASQQPAAADFDRLSESRDAPQAEGKLSESVDILPEPLQEIPADFVANTVTGQPRVAWVSGLMLLARRVGDPDNHAVFDGAWIDQQALADLLLGEVQDLFTNATLIPSDKPGTDGMVLASFPFRLHVPAPASSLTPLRESTVVSLAMSWAAALIALAATMWLVRGVMRLSERRASFVSAVTHELRTPLTTFRLYSDMLESGAVKEERRSEYLRVLSREADRLTHLVENVLAFSRIERGNARSKVRDVDADEMVENFRERLETRLEAAGLHLALDIPPHLRVRADQTAVEHILFNLIDNAAKYAASSVPPVVTISASRKHHLICLRIRDHGPGIPRSEARRIFRPFHKSAREAAETKPGVGLGLALSRRLAQEQGGELSCRTTDNGACFELRLPVATNR